ncbi:hypothetical protein LAJ57_12720, partial [Streptococcus pneumoniae]|uniref:deoxynucleotide monophosphate kinase family protein n=1 Tax=Streptococcus pneumoniae TaxID=1313 RepID=UPI001CBC6A16
IAYYPNEIEKMKKNKTFSEYITVRQLLQVFGTRVCRRIQDSCWIDGCVKDIIAEEAPFAVVGDCRFINEIIALRKTGAKVIKFTRKVDDDDDK